MYVLGTKLVYSGVTTSAFNLWAMSLAPDDILYRIIVLNLSKINFIEIIPISFCPFVADPVFSGPVIDWVKKNLVRMALSNLLKADPSEYLREH